MSSKNPASILKIWPQNSITQNEGCYHRVTENNYFPTGLNWSQLVQRALKETKQSLTSTEQILRPQRWQGSQSLVICLRNLPNPNQDGTCALRVYVQLRSYWYFIHISNSKRDFHGILLIFFSCH